MSKATPRAAVAKFAADGKQEAKKDLGLHAMSYGNVYVTQVAMGASDLHTVKAFAEAERYDGPSLILAYSHCIAHGIKMELGMDQQKAAMRSGHWLLYRYDPRRAQQGLNPLQLDSKKPSLDFKEYAYNETRYRMLAQAKPVEAQRLLGEAQKDIEERWQLYEKLASGDGGGKAPAGTRAPAAPVASSAPGGAK
jgi:pyruvate-ferredoxin/flavodoxin oxidoreductase